jgi:hypothetical protein
MAAIGFTPAICRTLTEETAKSCAFSKSDDVCTQIFLKTQRGQLGTNWDAIRNKAFRDLTANQPRRRRRKKNKGKRMNLEQFTARLLQNLVTFRANEKPRLLKLLAQNKIDPTLVRPYFEVLCLNDITQKNACKLFKKLKDVPPHLKALVKKLSSTMANQARLAGSDTLAENQTTALTAAIEELQKAEKRRTKEKIRQLDSQVDYLKFTESEAAIFYGLTSIYDLTNITPRKMTKHDVTLVTRSAEELNRFYPQGRGLGGQNRHGNTSIQHFINTILAESVTKNIEPVHTYLRLRIIHLCFSSHFERMGMSLQELAPGTCIIKMGLTNDMARFSMRGADREAVVLATSSSTTATAES